MFNTKDMVAGGLFSTLALLIGGYAMMTLDMGTMQRMGPGFFPTALACVLLVIGLATMLSSLRTLPSAIGAIPWRGLVFVLSAPIVFGATIRGLGFLPATVLTILLAVLASRNVSLVRTVTIAVLLTLFCIGVFIYGLRVPVRMIGPWLG